MLINGTKSVKISMWDEICHSLLLPLVLLMILLLFEKNLVLFKSSQVFAKHGFASVKSWIVPELFEKFIQRMEPKLYL